jgi:DNA-binding PadR family transcriptional regulator
MTSWSTVLGMATRPLATPAFLVLLALAAGHRHGYAMMGFAEEISQGSEQLPAGTLYRTLARLENDGLIAESGGRDGSAPQDAQRRYYRLTQQGREALDAETARLERLVAAARRSGATPDRGVA